MFHTHKQEITAGQSQKGRGRGAEKKRGEEGTGQTMLCVLCVYFACAFIFCTWHFILLLKTFGKPSLISSTHSSSAPSKASRHKSQNPKPAKQVQQTASRAWNTWKNNSRTLFFFFFFFFRYATALVQLADICCYFDNCKISLTPSLPWCHLKTNKQNAKSETLRPFCLLFCTGKSGMWKDFHQNA